MAENTYVKTAWQDHIQNPETGEIIQQGTRFTAERANNIEEGVHSAHETLATHTADYVKHPAFATATGAANTYAVTLNPAPTQYVEGIGIVVAINVDATAASSLNVNGLGAVPIKKANGNTVSNLKANGIYTVRYHAATTSFILQGEGASGNATASDLLSGKTASTDVGDITGTMPNRGSFNLGLGVTVPAGYYSGGTTAAGKKWASGTLPAQSVRLNDAQKIILDMVLDFNIGTVIIKANNGNYYCAYATVYGTPGWNQIGPSGFTGSTNTTGIYVIAPNPVNRLVIATRGGSSGSTVMDFTNLTWIAFES